MGWKNEHGRNPHGSDVLFEVFEAEGDRDAAYKARKATESYRIRERDEKIRKLASEPHNVSAVDLAKRFGLSRHQIHTIIRAGK